MIVLRVRAVLSFLRKLRAPQAAVGLGLAAAGIAVAVTGLASAVYAASYQYDALGRLTHVIHDDGGTVTYTYDANGNRTQVVTTPGPTYLAVNDVSVSEGGDLVFTVTRSGFVNGPHSVNYATADGTASGSDYIALAGTLSFTAGETAKTVTVATLQDAIYETGETVFLNLSGATNGATITDGQGVGTVVNDDPAPSFAVSDAPDAIEGGDLVFTITKTGATEVAHSVSYAASNGTASSSDYVPLSSFATFAPGEATKTVTVQTVQDLHFESDETVFLTLFMPTNDATISRAQGVGLIVNDDAPPTFAITENVTVAEGGVLQFTVTKSGPSVLVHEITYSTANGTAVAPDDYASTSGTITFPASGGDETRTIAVSTVQNPTFELSETMFVNLTGITNGAVIAHGQGIGTITDASPAPTFSVNDVSVAEGGSLVFTVTKTGATTLSHNVSYATATNTASAADFVSNSGVLSFAPGETTKTIAIATVHEAIYEWHEYMLLNLSSPTNGAIIADGQGVGTIVNDDAGPAFYVNDVAVAEGGYLYFTISKIGPTEVAHDIYFWTGDWTAIGGSDFWPVNTGMAFAPHEQAKTVAVATIHDTVYEPDQYLTLNLYSPTNGATIADSQGIGTIINDDPGPAFHVNDVAVAEGGYLYFTISKLGASEVAHDIHFWTGDWTAIGGSDYWPVNTGMNFAPHEQAKTVAVATIHDTTYEADEYMTLNLYAPTNGATIAHGQGIGTILNDDPPSPPYAVVADYPMDRYYIDYGTGDYYTFYDVILTGHDPDGGTAYFNDYNNPNSLRVERGYYYTNIYWYEYGGYYHWWPAYTFYMFDTTGGSAVYTLHGAYPNNYVAPIVLDLDGDGIELVPLGESRVSFDIGNDPLPERTGWVGPDDGLLVLDRDGDGRIATGAEISFVNDLPGARSDLEGLRAFDTNADGIFDARDQRFGEFLVWRDANQNGISEPSELSTLETMGVAALDLTIHPTGAGVEGATDNVITGLSRFLRTDGSEGLLGDVILRYTKPKFWIEEAPVADVGLSTQQVAQRPPVVFGLR